MRSRYCSPPPLWILWPWLSNILCITFFKFKYREKCLVFKYNFFKRKFAYLFKCQSEDPKWFKSPEATQHSFKLLNKKGKGIFLWNLAILLVLWFCDVACKGRIVPEGLEEIFGNKISKGIWFHFVLKKILISRHG